MKTVYLVLAVVGLLAPGLFIVWLFLRPGFDLATLLAPFTNNLLVAMLGVDLVLSSLVFWVFVFRESERRTIPYPWLYLLANLIFGLCFALPLFLYVRHDRGHPKR